MLFGNGEIRCGDKALQVPFQLRRFPEQICIDVEAASIGASLAHAPDADTWALSGTFDDGRALSCGRLLRIRGTVSFGRSRKAAAVFTPLNSAVVVGIPEATKPAWMEFPLAGFFGPHLDYREGDWRISLRPGVMQKEVAEQVYDGWGIVPEGSVLRLQNPRVTATGHEAMARKLCLFLALAMGTGITFHRSIAGWQGERRAEWWFEGVGAEPGPGARIPERCLPLYFRQCLGPWLRLPKDERERVRLVNGYVNESQTGYLDVRIMHAAQAWEIAASVWTARQQLTAEAGELKRELMASCRNWRRRHPYADPQAKLANRISFGFTWPLLHQRLVELVQVHCLDATKIGLDFETLKRARDAVVHTGRLPPDLSRNRARAHSLLKGAQRDLQVLLLVRLGYAGNINWSASGSRTEVPIAGLLR